jgi:histidinol dehydrogenase
MTVQEASPRGLKKLGPVVERLALAENLAAHQRAVRVRLEKLTVAAVYDRRKNHRRRSSTTATA